MNDFFTMGSDPIVFYSTILEESCRETSGRCQSAFSSGLNAFIVSQEGVRGATDESTERVNFGIIKEQFFDR